MWTLLFFATAFAPTPPGPPTGPPPSCSDRGGVLFEIDHLQYQQSELELFEGGKWTFHSKTREAQGCLSRDQMKTIRDDLARATWTGNVADAMCAAVSLGYTQYSTHGKTVWTQRMCQLEYLDATSRRSLDDIENILLTVSTEHKPPCCKK